MTYRNTNINRSIIIHFSSIVASDPMIDLKTIVERICSRCGVRPGVTEAVLDAGKGYDPLIQPVFREWQSNCSELTLLYKLCAVRTVSWDYQSSSDEQWEFAGRPAEGVWDYASWGSPYTGYSTALRMPRLEDVAYVRAACYRVTKKRYAEWQQEQARARKEYGRDINRRLQAEGADKRTVNAYWSMEWRKECSPEEFVNFVLNSQVNWRLAAAAKGWKLIDIAGAGNLRISVTRTVDLAKAVVRARGEKPASSHEVRSALRSGVDLPQSSPGIWSF